MPTVVTALSSPDAAETRETTVFVGRASALLAAADHLPGSVTEETWAAMVKSCDGGDHARSTHTWVDGNKVVALVLPEPCSRHNSESRSWAIPHGLSTAGTRSTTQVVVCVVEPEHATATALAVGRSFPSYSAKSKPHDRAVTIAAIGPTGVIDLTPIQPAIDAVRLAADLVDRPPNLLGTLAFVAEAKAVASRVGASIEVVQGLDLAERGLGGIYGVGKAATEPPAMVVLDLGIGDGGTVWVGKGIVYDTGGLSLKTKTGMPGMKTDMGGAAAVLAAFEAAVRSGFTGRLTAILCIAENAIGPEATRPDDVLTMYSGRTVEVNNTDAEGRLVLADGVAWAVRHRRPKTLIDMATLTGAQAVSTGAQHAAIYASDEAIETSAVETGRRTGDLCHALPYAPELFRKEFNSPVADMKNSVKNRANAQASCAAQFVANHLGDYLTQPGHAWLHIDMAAPSVRSGRGTGYGPALLLGLLRVI